MTTPKQQSYIYDATITKVVDGDTIDADVLLGFDIIARTRFRLFGIDTAEKTSDVESAKKIAIAGSEFTKKYLGQKVTIESLGKDKYGRWLAKVHVADGLLNELLVENGLAKAYFGGNKQELGWEKR